MTHGAAAAPAAPAAVRDRLRVPIRDGRFWAIQALVLIIAAADFAADVLLPQNAVVSIVIVTLFFIPVTYAAVAFDFGRATATALWCVVVDFPIMLAHHRGAPEVEQMFLLAAIAGAGVYVAYWVDREAAARAALQSSQVKYRNLFETSPVPTILVDGDGGVRDFNPAAAALAPSPEAAATSPRALVDLIGSAPAAAIIGFLRARPPGALPIAVRTPTGGDLWLEPTVTRLPDGPRDTVYQIQLCDVTRERRREDSLRLYARAVVRGQEDERQRLAQDLHDETIQDLMIHCRRLDDLNRAVSAQGPDAIASVRDARHSAERIVQELRERIRALRPAVLDDLGLVAAIEQIVGRYRQQTGTTGEFRVRGAACRLSAETELGLFRITQEAVRNVERHARATRLRVELGFDPGQVRLLVTDDGAGFVFDGNHDLAADGHFGLLGMRERAHLLDGSLEILTSPRRGTQITVSVPG